MQIILITYKSHLIPSDMNRSNRIATQERWNFPVSKLDYEAYFENKKTVDRLEESIIYSSWSKFLQSSHWENSMELLTCWILWSFGPHHLMLHILLVFNLCTLVRHFESSVKSTSSPCILPDSYIPNTVQKDWSRDACYCFMHVYIMQGIINKRCWWAIAFHNLSLIWQNTFMSMHW